MKKIISLILGVATLVANVYSSHTIELDVTYEGDLRRSGYFACRNEVHLYEILDSLNQMDQKILIVDIKDSYSTRIYDGLLRRIKSQSLILDFKFLKTLEFESENFSNENIIELTCISPCLKSVSIDSLAIPNIKVMSLVKIGAKRLGRRQLLTPELEILSISGENLVSVCFANVSLGVQGRLIVKTGENRLQLIKLNSSPKTTLSLNAKL